MPGRQEWEKVKEAAGAVTASFRGAFDAPIDTSLVSRWDAVRSRIEELAAAVRALVVAAATDVNPNFKDVPESWRKQLDEDRYGSQTGGMVAAAGRQVARVEAIAAFGETVSQLPAELDSVKTYVGRIGLDPKDWKGLSEVMTLAIPFTGEPENKALWDKLDPLRKEATEVHEPALKRLSAFASDVSALADGIGKWGEGDPRHSERLDRLPKE